MLARLEPGRRGGGGGGAAAVVVLVVDASSEPCRLRLGLIRAALLGRRRKGGGGGGISFASGAGDCASLTGGCAID